MIEHFFPLGCVCVCVLGTDMKWKRILYKMSMFALYENGRPSLRTSAILEFVFKFLSRLKV